ncbi:hypothetical protein BHM03_00036400 [Ensete ventricosum]|nr:hypothetical protein BHM03_00036400 [Ensete ventricosum]
MKSCHDVVLVINEESLGPIQECSNTSKEYALQAPLPEQRPYNPESSEISILAYALEMTLLDRVHDAGRLVTIMGNQASLLEAEINKLKTEGDPEQLAAAQQQVAELQADNAKIRSELEELARQSNQADKELNELWVDLADSQRQINEQKAYHRKADNNLLKMMRENETLKVGQV